MSTVVPVDNEVVRKGNTLFGFRGISYNSQGRAFARIVAGVQEPKLEVLVFDIPVDGMPPLLDISKDSDFDRSGKWYHFPETREGYEIVTQGRHGDVVRVTLAGQVFYDTKIHGPILD